MSVGNFPGKRRDNAISYTLFWLSLSIVEPFLSIFVSEESYKARLFYCILSQIPYTYLAYALFSYQILRFLYLISFARHFELVHVIEDNIEKFMFALVAYLSLFGRIMSMIALICPIIMKFVAGRASFSLYPYYAQRFFSLWYMLIIYSSLMIQYLNQFRAAIFIIDYCFVAFLLWLSYHSGMIIESRFINQFREKKQRDLKRNFRIIGLVIGICCINTILYQIFIRTYGKSSVVDLLSISNYALMATHCVLHSEPANGIEKTMQFTSIGFSLWVVFSIFPNS